MTRGKKRGADGKEQCTTVNCWVAGGLCGLCGLLREGRLCLRRPARKNGVPTVTMLGYVCTYVFFQCTRAGGEYMQVMEGT